MTTTIRKINGLFDKGKALSPLFIRLIAGFHLIYVTKGAAFSSGKMQSVVHFFASQEIPASHFLAPIVVYAEFICGILFICGLFTRAAAIVMTVVFICAISIVDIDNSYTSAFPALVMLAGSVSLLLSGSGNLSFDSFFRKKNQAGI